jgi:hypothetical protein
MANSKQSNPWFDEHYLENVAKGIYGSLEHPGRSLVTGLRSNANSRRQRALEALGTSPPWVESTSVLWVVSRDGVRTNLPVCLLDSGESQGIKGLMVEHRLTYDVFSPFLAVAIDYVNRPVTEVERKASYCAQHDIRYAHAGGVMGAAHEEWLAGVRRMVDERRQARGLPRLETKQLVEPLRLGGQGRDDDW